MFFVEVKRMLEKKQVSLFLVVSFAIGFALQSGFYIYRNHAMFWLGLALWAPTIGVLSTGKKNLRLILENLSYLGLYQYWLSYLLGILPHLTGSFLLVAVGEANWGLSVSVGRLLLKIIINPIATTLFGALGEEIGWRGYLQPMLRRYLSAPMTFLLVGIIWSYWHLVANLGGYNGAQYPVLSALLLFPVGCTAQAFILGWIRENTGKIWVCALYHGVFNTVSNIQLIHSSNEIKETIAIDACLVLTAILLMKFFPLDEKPWAKSLALIVEDSLVT